MHLLRGTCKCDSDGVYPSEDQGISCWEWVVDEWMGVKAVDTARGP